MSPGFSFFTTQSRPPDDKGQLRAKALASPELRRLDPTTAFAIRGVLSRGNVFAGDVLRLLESGALSQLTVRDRATAMAALNAPNGTAFAQELVEAMKTPSAILALTPEVRTSALRNLGVPGVSPLVRSGVLAGLALKDQLALLAKVEAAPRDRLQNPTRPVDIAIRALIEPLAAPHVDAKVLALATAELTRIAGGAAPRVVARGVAPRLAFHTLWLDDAQMAKVQAITDVGRFDTRALLLDTGRALLLQRDFNGATMLDSLYALATGPVLQGIDRSTALHKLMQELDWVQEVNQGGRKTCSVTAVSDLLAKNAPAEYTRLVVGLLSRGEVTLANGDTVRPPSDALAEDDSGRSPGERLLQSTLMEYGNGAFRNYSNQTDQHTNVLDLLGLRPSHGLWTEEVARVMSGVFARPFVSIERGEATSEQLLDLLKPRSGQDTLVGFDWGTGSHLVVVERIEDGRVYLREPNRSLDESFTHARVEDSFQARLSITLDDARGRINSVVVPR